MLNVGLATIFYGWLLVTFFLFSPGPCITSVLPGHVCTLEAVATECNHLMARLCTCKEGFTYQGMDCVGKHWTHLVQGKLADTVEMIWHFLGVG